MSERKGEKDEGIGNLFKIIDGILYQLHRTKRMFIVMILTVMILPPVALFVTSLVNEPPFPGMGRTPPGPGYPDPAYSLMRQLPLIISIVWLGVGIYQWYVLSKWTKKYDRYKERQKQAEAKLGDPTGDEKSDSNGS